MDEHLLLSGVSHQGDAPVERATKEENADRAVREIVALLDSIAPFDPRDKYRACLIAAGIVLAKHCGGDIEPVINTAPNYIRASLIANSLANPEYLASKRLLTMPTDTKN